jgi:hypothetical protein
MTPIDTSTPALDTSTPALDTNDLSMTPIVGDPPPAPTAPVVTPLKRMTSSLSAVPKLEPDGEPETVPQPINPLVGLTAPRPSRILIAQSFFTLYRGSIFVGAIAGILTVALAVLFLRTCGR